VSYTVFGSLLSWWSATYSDSAVTRTIVEFAHVAGLILGAGAAIAADRMTLLARRWTIAERHAHLRTLNHTHEIVAVGLAILFVSGVLLVAADPGTFLHSKLFWTKMSLIVFLMANGWRVWSAGKGAFESGSADWRRLQTTAIVSVVLWLATTLAGAALPNVG